MLPRSCRLSRRAAHVAVTPTGGGAEVRGVNLKDVDEDGFRLCVPKTQTRA
jgi:hypothetical protein